MSIINEQIRSFLEEEDEMVEAANDISEAYVKHGWRNE